MATIIFANNAQTTLAGPISSGATSVNLAAGTGALFPSPAAGQYFVMTFTDLATGLIHEIVNVTARSGDVLTIVRSREGTTARSWLANDIAGNWWTAGSAAMLVQITPLQQQAGNYGADTGSTNNLVVALSPAPATLASIIGSPIRIKVGNTNTGSSVLTLTPLASTTITNPDGSNLFTGQLVAGHIFEVVYNGTTYDLMTAPYELLARANTWLSTQTFGTVAATTVGATTVNATTVNATAVNASANIGGNTVTASAGATGSSNGARVTNLNDFPGSSGTTGWAKLPNGLIFQWGTETITNWTGVTASARTSFATPFPNNCLNITICESGGGTWITGGNATMYSVAAGTIGSGPASNFQIIGLYWNGSAFISPPNGNAFGQCWIAIGY